MELVIEALCKYVSREMECERVDFWLTLFSRKKKGRDVSLNDVNKCE